MWNQTFQPSFPFTRLGKIPVRANTNIIILSNTYLLRWMNLECQLKFHNSPFSHSINCHISLMMTMNVVPSSRVGAKSVQHTQWSNFPYSVPPGFRDVAIAPIHANSTNHRDFGATRNFDQSPQLFCNFDQSSRSPAKRRHTSANSLPCFVQKMQQHAQQTCVLPTSHIYLQK